MVNRRHKPYSKFKGYMVEHGIKQKEVAELLNKSQSAFNQNLNGTGGDFSVSELRLLCKTYNLSATEFFLAV
ncbi:MAG: helix-turn-helix transcriptional regulator [Vallitalea sp.]|nr:helix-turn-helix transcriptional regulator [Vallitalea sp.]